MKYRLLISIPLAWMWMYTKTMLKKCCNLFSYLLHIASKQLHTLSQVLYLGAPEHMRIDVVCVCQGCDG